MIQDFSKYFALLNDKELFEEINTVGFIKSVEAGTMLMDIGQYIKYMPLVLSGSVKITREDNDGNEILLYYLEGGNTCAVSFTCCMQNETSGIRAIAEEDTELIMIPVEYMDIWMGKYKDWRNFVLFTFSRRMDELFETLDSIAFDSMDKRLIKYLKDRSRVLKKEEFTITHQEIALSLNSSREAVSRLLKKLENMGAIKLGRNKIQLLDLI